MSLGFVGAATWIVRGVLGDFAGFFPCAATGPQGSDIALTRVSVTRVHLSIAWSPGDGEVDDRLGPASNPDNVDDAVHPRNLIGFQIAQMTLESAIGIL